MHCPLLCQGRVTLHISHQEGVPHSNGWGTLWRPLASRLFRCLPLCTGVEVEVLGAWGGFQKEEPRERREESPG